MDMCICENRECVANDFHIYQKFFGEILISWAKIESL